MVDVVDVRAGTRLSLHDTILSFGGRRLAVSDDGKQFVTGSWGNPGGGGVACYDTATGERLWHRRELKQNQVIRNEGRSNAWIVERHVGGTHVIDRKSSSDRFRLRGWRNFLGVDETGLLLFESGLNIAFVEPYSGELVRSIRPPDMFDYISEEDPYGSRAKYGIETRVAVSCRHQDQFRERRRTRLVLGWADRAGNRLVVEHRHGTLQLLDLSDGALVWEVLLGSLGFSSTMIDHERGHVWVATPHESDRVDEELVRLDLETGAVIDRRFIGLQMRRAQFCAGGTLLVSGWGVLDLLSGEIRCFEV